MCVHGDTRSQPIYSCCKTGRERKRESSFHSFLIGAHANRRPHGALHDVVRWVHRSTFVIRPPVPPHPGQRARNLRIPIPHTDGFFIDPGWYGKVVLESEGTHEGLADLQARCGHGVFPPRAETLATKMRNEKEKDNRRVWRILREKRYVSVIRGGMLG